MWNVKGRRENLSPLFIIGGRYSRKNPFFENRVKVDANKINVSTLQELLEDDNIRNYTYAGVIAGIFDNEDKLKDVLKAESVSAVFNHLKKEVEQYYGEGNQD